MGEPTPRPERPSTRFAVIDLGSNGPRFAVGQLKTTSGWKAIEVENDNIFLGDQLGGLSDRDRLNLFKQSIEHFIARLENEFGVTKDQILLAATASLRHQSYRDSFLEEIRGLGISAEVISGRKEGYITYLGFVSKGVVSATSTCALIDIGGESTELVIVKNGVPFEIMSLKLGMVSEVNEHPVFDTLGLDHAYMTSSSAGTIIAALSALDGAPESAQLGSFYGDADLNQLEHLLEVFQRETSENRNNGELEALKERLKDKVPQNRFERIRPRLETLIPLLKSLGINTISNENVRFRNGLIEYMYRKMSNQLGNELPGGQNLLLGNDYTRHKPTL